MKTYKIDPLGKNRPLMLVRGTRLPESFPDSVAEHMAKSLKANCRGVFATINGEISSSTVSPGVVMSKEANEDNNTLVVMTEGMQNESVEWEDTTGKQFRLEHAGGFAGSQYGGHDKYYTGAHKDLRTFVTGAVPYTGQPLVAANAKQWYSYTTPEGVSLTFRGCIQAPIKDGTGFVGLKIDRINFNGLDTVRNFDLTLDCDSAVSLGLRNGMNDDSKPFNMRTGIGWLQIVATDDFKSHIKGFNESIGSGDAEINPYGFYDGFTYSVNLRAIMTQPGCLTPAGNNASFGIRVKNGSALEDSIIANASGYASEDFGLDMSGSGDTFPMVEEVSTTLDAEPTVINLTTYNEKHTVVVNLSSVQEGEQLHLDLSDTVTAHGYIYFRSMNTSLLDIKPIGAGEKNLVIDVPQGDDVFAYFGVQYNAAGTLTISRTAAQPEPGPGPEPTRTPGFYSSDGQLVKAMTKEEVEQNYTDDNYPAKTNAEVRNATSFVWPEGVTSIGNQAFESCTGLTSVTIPSTVTSIGEYAFLGCSGLTSATIPEGATSIGSGAFSMCSALTSVTIPNTVTTIGYGAFKECSALTSVTIPEGVTSIGSHAFERCNALTSVAIPEGVTSIDEATFENCTGLTSVTIPNTVTTIGFWAFSGCTGLNPLVVPNGVTTIWNDAFKDVPKVIYGGTATGTPWGALEVVAPKPTPGFYGADGQLIKAMTKEEVEQDYSYPNNPADANVAIKNATKFVWPDGVTKVGNNTFYDCSKLTSVTIPEGVTSIGNGAFGSCSGLTSVSIPSTVTSMGNSAFSGCSKLTSVTIPEGVTSIGNSTFSGCTALTSVTIPNTVTSIGSFAFKKCTGLNPLVVPNGVATIGSDAFKSVPKVIYGGQATGTPWGALEVVAPTRTPGFYNAEGQLIKAMTKEEVETNYTSDNDPSTTTPEVLNATEFVWPEGVTKVGNSVFYNCLNLTSVTIPSTVTSIGNDAFQSCSALASVTIPEGVTSIGDGAFNGCTALTTAPIPSTVTSIGDEAFHSCSGLTSVTIPEGVTSIGFNTFGSCSGLTSVTIPSTVTSIGGYAFSDCTSLNPLVVPNTVTSIDMSAFENVPKVIYGGTATGSPWGAKEVSTGGSTPDPGPNPGPGPEPDPEPAKDPGFYSADGQLVKAMTKEEVEQDYVYSACPSATTQTIKNATKFVWPEGVTKVGNNAFYECKGLTSLDIPSTVTSIGNSAFDSCSGLTSLDIPSTVTSIGNGAFSKCSGLTSLSIPSTVTSIANNAFAYCTGLTSVTIPEGVTAIGNSAFSGCTGLTSVTIPSTVTSIGQWAFKKCSALNPLTVPNTVTTIGNDAFKNVPKVIYSGSASGSPWGATAVAAS